MGAARRRRQLQAGLETIQSEGQGVYRLEVLPVAAFPAFLADAMYGNKERANMIVSAIREFEKADPRPLCLLCDYEFNDNKKADAFVFLSADIKGRRMLLINSLCPQCAINPDLQDNIVAHYRANMISDLRVIHPHYGAGRA